MKAELNKCPHCGADVDDRMAFCPSCGGNLNNLSNKYCTQCGTPLTDAMGKCPNCGAIIEDEREIQINKKKLFRFFEIVCALFPFAAIVFAFIFMPISKELYDYPSMLFDFFPGKNPWIEGHIVFYLVILTTLLYAVMVLVNKRMKIAELILLSINIASSLYLLVAGILILNGVIYEKAEYDFLDRTALIVCNAVSFVFSVINLLIFCLFRKKAYRQQVSRKVLIVSAIASLIVLCSASAITAEAFFVPASKYNYALSLSDEDIDESIKIFDSINVKDSARRADFARAKKIAINQGNYLEGLEYILKHTKRVSIHYWNGKEYVRWGQNEFVSKEDLSSLKQNNIFDGYDFSYGFSLWENGYLYDASVKFKLSECETLLFSANGNQSFSVSLKDSEITTVRVPSKFVGLPVINLLEFYMALSLETLTLPNSILYINDSIAHCYSLKTIIFEGIKEEWDAITKSQNWKPESLEVVHCTDGDIVF